MRWKLRVRRNNAYYALGICKVDILLFHSTEDDLKGVHEVLEDGDFPLFALAVREPLVVDEAHLLQHRRLARFPRS